MTQEEVASDKPTWLNNIFAIEVVSTAAFVTASLLFCEAIHLVLGVQVPFGFLYTCPPLLIHGFMPKGFCPCIPLRLVQLLHKSITPFECAMSCGTQVLVIAGLMFKLHEFHPRLLLRVATWEADMKPNQGTLVEAACTFYFVLVCCTIPAFLAKRGLPKLLVMLAIAPMMMYGKKFTGPALTPAFALASLLLTHWLKVEVPDGSHFGTQTVSNVTTVYLWGPLLGTNFAAFVLHWVLGRRFPRSGDLRDPPPWADGSQLAPLDGSAPSQEKKRD